MRLLFVWIGGIGRSLTAEAIMLHVLVKARLEAQVFVDSAGLGAWLVGERPDPRARAAAERRGIALRSIARQVTSEGFDSFDVVLAADASNQ